VEGRANEQTFARSVLRLAEVEECHRVTGEFLYLLKIWARDIEDLNLLVEQKIKALAGVVRTRTLVVLSSPKEHVTGSPSVAPNERFDIQRAATSNVAEARGMVNGMANTTKITITLPDRQLEEIRKRVAARDSPNVSRFIQQAVQKSLENSAEFHAMVEEALRETGGPLKPSERAWAKGMLSARRRRAKPRKAA
jgi:Arc/MetJ-type ribon-helix-helix transcriptional regulator